MDIHIVILGLVPRIQGSKLRLYCDSWVPRVRVKRGPRASSWNKSQDDIRVFNAEVFVSSSYPGPP